MRKSQYATARLCQVSPVKGKKLKFAAGCRCDSCQEFYPAQILEIHYVSDTRDYGVAISADLQKALLFVCPVCHREVHKILNPLQ